MSTTDVKKYVRLSPTTLFRAPHCYLEHDPYRDRCKLCPVRHPCWMAIPPERREVSEVRDVRNAKGDAVGSK